MTFVCTSCLLDLPEESYFFGMARGKKRRTSRCRKCLSAIHKEYRERTREACAARAAAYVERHREKINEYNRAYQKKWRAENAERNRETERRYRENNPESIARAQAKYAKNNRDKRNEKDARRRARKLASPRIEKIDRAYIIARDNSTCHICEKRVARKDLELDHLIPLAHGGSHTADNLRVAHKRCNGAMGAGRLPAQLLLIG